MAQPENVGECDARPNESVRTGNAAM